MRTHGTLTRWNDDRGFGFITTPKGEELFVHVSAFPRGERPRVGELISFETEVDKKNRTRAIRVMRPGQKSGARPERPRRASPSRKWHGAGISLAIVAALGAYGYSRYVNYKNNPAGDAQPMSLSEESSVEQPASDSAFKCDGRQHCSQMNSCDEARFFVANCSNVKMDGDGDGRPCEDWCGH